MLEYCKEHWIKWDEGVIDISFNEYMKRTCQHLYFEEIFSDFRNKYDNKLDAIDEVKSMSQQLQILFLRSPIRS